MPMNLDDVATLNVIGTVGANDHVHTLSFRKTGTGELTDLITAWNATCQGPYRGCFTTSESPVKLIRAVHTCGTDPLDAPVDFVPVSASQLGTRSNASGAMPSFMAALVSEKGVSSGRRRSGRFFLGGLREDDNQGNIIDPAYVTIVAIYTAALTAAFITPTTPNWRLVTWSRTQRLEGGSCLQSSSPVASLIIRTAPTTMRSRKLGHGN